MNNLRRFYSTAGRASILQLVGVALPVAAILFAVSHVSWLWGLAPNVLAGAVGGAALAKLVVVAIRRLRDAGINLHRAAWTALASGTVTTTAFLSFMASDPPWAGFVLTAMGYAVPIVCGVALLWPPDRQRDEHQRDGDRPGTTPGMTIAIVFTLGGAMLLGFIAWVSIGMDADNRRSMAIEAERNRAGIWP